MSRTTGAYMAAICGASPSSASLMSIVDLTCRPSSMNIRLPRNAKQKPDNLALKGPLFLYDQSHIILRIRLKRRRHGVFGPVWAILYLSMAVSAWLVWRREGFSGAKTAMVRFSVQLALTFFGV